MTYLVGNLVGGSQLWRQKQPLSLWPQPKHSLGIKSALHLEPTKRCAHQCAQCSSSPSSGERLSCSSVVGSEMPTVTSSKRAVSVASLQSAAPAAVWSKMIAWVNKQHRVGLSGALFPFQVLRCFLPCAIEEMFTNPSDKRTVGMLQSFSDKLQHSQVVLMS